MTIIDFFMYHDAIKQRSIEEIFRKSLFSALESKNLEQMQLFLRDTISYFEKFLQRNAVKEILAHD